jgi:hypothetical protein
MKAMVLICLPVIGCLILTGSAVRAQRPDDQIKQVFADWEMRRETIKRIRYTVVGQSIKPKGSYTDDMGQPITPPHPPKDIAMRQDSTLLLDLAKNRFRLEMAGERYYLDGQQAYPYAGRTLFDNQTLATENPRDANENAAVPRKATDPDVTISRNYARSGYHALEAVNAFYLSPLLMAHGIVPGFSAPADFDKRPDPDDFTVRGRHFFQGRDCLVLRTFPDRSSGLSTSFDEFWIDTARESAVLYEACYANDKVRVSIEITYQQTSHGWLPLKWTGTTRDSRGQQPINVTRLTVQAINVEPVVTDKDFQPDVKPGMYVSETIHEDLDAFGSSPLSLKKTKLYHVAADGSWNQVLDGVENKSGSWYWYGAGGVIVAVAMAAIVFRYLRRRGNDNTKPLIIGT